MQFCMLSKGFSGGSGVKNLTASEGDTDSIPGLGRSPGEGNGSSFQYSFLRNPRGQGEETGTGDRGQGAGGRDQGQGAGTRAGQPPLLSQPRRDVSQEGTCS